MQYRELGRTGWKVSTISFGAWAIGGTWGKVDDKESMEALHKAVECGINFFDTADVYGDGHSERLIAEIKRLYGDKIKVATKAGRRLNPHTADGYNRENLTAFVERSLKNLKMEALDLLQLHCPPADVYYQPQVFAVMDELVRQGKIRFYGVSVERVEEALKALEFPNVQSIQIIFNMFRQRPAELFFEQAKQKKTGILARVPLASGMLTGKLTPHSSFETDDHRHFNRNGESFDRGETFSGVDYNKGLEVVEDLKKICPPNTSLAQFAMRWILMHEAVTCAIPGAKRSDQVVQNAAAADLPELTDQAMFAVKNLYDLHLKSMVHQSW